jgi:hypothetical protein
MSEELFVGIDVCKAELQVAPRRRQGRAYAENLINLDQWKAAIHVIANHQPCSTLVALHISIVWFLPGVGGRGLVQIAHSRCQALLDLFWCPVVGVVQGRLLQSSEVGFDQAKPRAIGRKPVDAQPSAQAPRQFPQCLRVGAKIVHNQMNRAARPKREHLSLPELSAILCRFRGEAFADCPAGGGAEGAKPLQSPIALVAVRPSRRAPTPGLAASGNRLQRPHLIKANGMPSLGRIAVQAHDSVFFTSKSGSSLSHQVWPVRKRRP